MSDMLTDCPLCKDQGIYGTVAVGYFGNSDPLKNDEGQTDCAVCKDQEIDPWLWVVLPTDAFKKVKGQTNYIVCKDQELI